MSCEGMLPLAAGLTGVTGTSLLKGELAMSAKATVATFAALLTAVSIQGAASAQDNHCRAAFNVHRLKSKIPSNARASATPSGLPFQHRLIEYSGPTGVIRDDTAYHGYFTLPEADPDYHGSNGG